MRLFGADEEFSEASALTTPAKEFEFPFARLRLKPNAKDPVVSAFPDQELGREAFTYSLKSGKSDTVHLDAVLDYNRDEDYLRELILYKLSCQAQECIRRQRVSKRHLARQLKTSPAQLYRLLDQTFYGKTIDQMIRLLSALNCPVEIQFKKVVT